MSITFEQAAKLIELANRANKKARVRTISAEDKQHLGRAFLIKVLNKHSALIQPFHHRKEEIVPLQTIRFWKAGCEFDISDAVNIANGNDRLCVVEADLLIYSASKNAVWCGDKIRWSRAIDDAQKFSQNSVNVRDFADDALLVSPAEAHEKLFASTNECAIECESCEPSKFVESDVVRVEQTDATVSSVKEEEMAKSNIVNAVDVDAIQKFVNAITIANRDLIEIESLRIEAQKRLDDARMGLHTLTGGASQEVKFVKNNDVALVRVNKNTNKKSAYRGTKPGVLRSAVLSVLAKGPCDFKTLVNQVMMLVPTTTVASAGECIYLLRRRKFIKGDARKLMLV